MVKKKVIIIVCLSVLVSLPMQLAGQIPMPHMPIATRTEMPSLDMHSTCTMHGAMSGYSGDVNMSRGLSTAAVSILGGVTTLDLYGPTEEEQLEEMLRHVRRVPGQPTDCECTWVWDEGKQDYVCSRCGHTALEGCTCDPCRCPISSGWQMIAFMALLSMLYVWKKRAAAISALQPTL